MVYSVFQIWKWSGVKALSTPHLFDRFIKFPCLAAAFFRLALVVLVEEKLAPDELLFVCELQLGKNTSNKHLILEQSRVNQSHSVSNLFSWFGERGRKSSCRGKLKKVFLN